MPPRDMRWPAQKHTDRTTDTTQPGRAVREVHADATGGRGHERRSARDHKLRPVTRQCDAGTQNDAETIPFCSGKPPSQWCDVSEVELLLSVLAKGAYIRCMRCESCLHVLVTPRSRIGLELAPLLISLSTSRSCVPHTMNRLTSHEA